MSWHYSLEQEADFSLPDYLDGLRSQRSRSSDTPAKSSCSDSGMDTLSRSQSGTMCEPSMVAPGVDSLMLFRGDFPAKTSARRVKVRDLPEPVVAFGLSICESLRKYGLDMSSRKTVRTCVPVDSAPSSKGLPSWGMTHDGVCWELGTSVRRTSETGCGSWLPTPQASDHITKRTSKSWKEQGRVNFCLSNPEIQAMWPTPTVCGNYNRKGASKSSGDGLATAVGGKLNPDWVEWLMGWVPGWTDLEPLATDKFQQWQRQHSGF